MELGFRTQPPRKGIIKQDAARGRRQPRPTPSTTTTTSLQNTTHDRVERRYPRNICWRSRCQAQEYGPDVPPESPDWVKDLYRQAEEFPDETHLKDLLKDTGGDPMKIEMNARRKLAESNIGQNMEYAEKAEMKVHLDEVNSFSLWVWFEFFEPPNDAEQELLENVLESWFILGKLGSFNTLNMQISNSYDTSPSFFNYDGGELESSIPAMFHEMQQVEYNGTLGRIWVNMGTCDEMALDVLINGLSNFSREYFSIRELLIGGQEFKGWIAPKMQSPFGESMN